jgi:hypothetical protein
MIRPDKLLRAIIGYYLATSSPLRNLIDNKLEQRCHAHIVGTSINIKNETTISALHSTLSRRP